LTAYRLYGARAFINRSGDTWQQRHIYFNRAFADTTVNLGYLTSSYPENNNSYLLLEGRSGLTYAPTAWLPNGSVAINQFHGSYGRGSHANNQTASLQVNSPDNQASLNTLDILRLTTGTHANVNNGDYTTRMYVNRNGDGWFDGLLTAGNYSWNTDQDTTGLDGQVMTFNGSSKELELSSTEKNTATTDANYSVANDFNNSGALREVKLVTNVTGSAVSDVTITLPTPNATHEGKKVYVKTYDDNGTYDVVITATSGSFYTGSAAGTSNVNTADGDTTTIICLLNGDTSTYGWYVW